MKRKTLMRMILLHDLGQGNAQDQQFLRQYTNSELRDMKQRRTNAVANPASNPFAKKEKRRRRRR